jgi:hypothetical protein
MGGYGSTRWAQMVTRVSTEGLPRLDVRALARAGALQRGAVATITWGDTIGITTEVGLNEPDIVVVKNRYSIGIRMWEFVCESIPLVTSPCHFGGVRRWFACPGCGSRIAVLYGVGGVFRCRACHRVAYASTRAKSSRKP